MSFNDMTNEQIVARYGGTTWERIQDRYLVAAGSSSHTVGSTGGSSTVTLTTNNLPSHSHSYTNTIVGSTKLTINQIPSHHHFNESTPTKNLVVGGNALDVYGYSGIGATESPGMPWGKGVYPEGGSGSHTHGNISQSKTTGTTGSGTAVNIEPPYIAIYMWKRTA